MRGSFPDREQFPGITSAYLDSATQHPIPTGAREAAAAYLAARGFGGSNSGVSGMEIEARVHRLFARLINAEPDEIASVPSTAAGEQFVIRALGIKAGDRIVTDNLHFPGSSYVFDYLGMQGIHVHSVSECNGRVDIEQMERAITPGTRLVAVSWISGVNGFEHDLERLVRVAHASGALVYADLIQGVGAVPFDARATGVDFAACSSFKWLMGDFGIGLLYVRKELLEGLLRPHAGYYQLDGFRRAGRLPNGDASLSRPTPDANGLFAMSTLPLIVLAQLESSLEYILANGVDRIYCHAQTLVSRLRQGFEACGLQVLTPPRSRAPILTCSIDGAPQLVRAMASAGVVAAVSDERLRASVSVFNDTNDVDRLLDVLRHHVAG